MLIKIFDSLSLVFVYANYILHTHFKYSNIELSYILSECVLFNDKWNLFSYIIRTGYIQWNDDNIRFVLYSDIIIPANLCTVLEHYYPSQPLYCTRTLLSQPTFVLYSDIIIPAIRCTVLGHYYPSQPVREAAITNFIVFGLIRTGLEPPDLLHSWRSYEPLHHRCNLYI
jgi:hypothetical protein